MKKILFLSALSALTFGACKELNEPVAGHFFVMNSDDEYRLLINGEDLGVIPRVDEIPVICEDSVLMLTMAQELELKRNTFQVVDQSGTVLIDGKFKLGRSVSMTASGSIDTSAVYFLSGEDYMIMGFNTPFIHNNDLREACE